jgi:Fe-S-cluster-containing hydrogenase component 2
VAAGRFAWHKASVAYFPDRCIAVRAPHISCTRCADVCPVRVLRAEDGPMVADAGCIACGRCAAQCPTGAIEAAGFAMSVTPAADGMPIEVECRRVPSTSCRADGIRVPCLGGIDAGGLLELLLEAGDRPVRLIDRGWCADCPAGGPVHPARRNLDAVTTLLTAMGKADLAPALVMRPLPHRRAAKAVDQDGPAGPTRRAVFRRLSGAGEEAAVSERPQVRRASASAPLDPGLRRRTAAALQALSLRLDRPQPGAFYPALRVSDACCNHQVCTPVCPTAALVSTCGAAAETLMFDSALCIACAACVRHCPEHAVSLEAEGGTAGPVALRRHQVRACTLCEKPFAEPGTETLCPHCRKRQSFAQAGFAFRFGLQAQPEDEDRDVSAAPCQRIAAGGSAQQDGEGRPAWMD